MHQHIIINILAILCILCIVPSLYSYFNQNVANIYSIYDAKARRECQSELLSSYKIKYNIIPNTKYLKKILYSYNDVITSKYHYIIKSIAKAQLLCASTASAIYNASSSSSYIAKFTNIPNQKQFEIQTSSSKIFLFYKQS